MSVTTAPRVRSTVSTSQMTRVELARVVADHLGWTAAEGGWIYEAQPSGAIVQGWETLAELLGWRGWIVQGKGVAWALIPGAGTPGQSAQVARIIRRAAAAARSYR